MTRPASQAGRSRSSRTEAPTRTTGTRLGGVAGYDLTFSAPKSLSALAGLLFLGVVEALEDVLVVRNGVRGHPAVVRHEVSCVSLRSATLRMRPT